MNSSNSLNTGGIPLMPISGAWPDPIPFSMPTALPSFPLVALPDVLGNMVREVEACVGIAPDVPAMLGLTTTASAAAGGFEVRVGDTHNEVLALWTVSLLESGERKTAAFDHMVAPASVKVVAA